MLISLEENRRNVIEAVANTALRFTVQLLVRSEDRPELLLPFGSGVFVKRKRKLLLLTAGHCIRQKETVFRIGVNKAGQYHAIQGHSFVHSDEALDVGFVVLSTKSAEFCERHFLFLDEAKLAPHYDAGDDDHYVVAGYPVTRTKVSLAKKVISTEPFVLETTSKPPLFYRANGIDPRRQLAMPFHRRMSRFYGDQNLHKSPDPVGISGSGLWCVSSLVCEEPKNASFSLVGIMIEYHSSQSFFKATHIRQVLHMIDPVLDYFPFDAE